MDNNRQSKITRAWMALVGTAVIALGTAGVAQAILYGAAHTGGKFGASTLYTIDPAKGTATPVGPIGFDACSGMDFHPATAILYATCFRPATGPDPGPHVLITIDPVTGAGTEVGLTGVEVLPSGLTVSDISFRNSDHAMYAYLKPGDGVGTIKITTGAATELGSSGSVGSGNGIAFSPADRLFHATEGPLNTLDQKTGAATFVATLSFPVCSGGGFSPRVNAMDFQPGTGILFGSVNYGEVAVGGGPNCLVTINTMTGVVTLIGLTVSGLDALAWLPVADHFKCYKAGGKKVEKTVRLEDQFGIEPRVKVKEPELFCNPVSKNEERIKNPAGHLTCYEIEDGDDDEERRLRVKDQFGERTLKVGEPKLLCVQSETISVVDDEDDDGDEDDGRDRDRKKGSKRGRDD